MFGDADIFIAVMLILAPFVIVALLIFFKIRADRKYPYKALVSYEQGGAMGQIVNTSYWDKIGYVDIKDKDGASTGAKTWQLQKNKKTVAGFDLTYLTDLEEKKFIFMKWKTKVAHVLAIMGENGEEFKPIKMDISTKTYTPVFDGDRAQAILKIYNDIINRNTLINWLQKNIFEIVKVGLELLIVIMLLLVVLRIGDMITVMTQSNAMMGEALRNLALIQNKTANATVKAPTGNIGGIPFAGLPSGG